MRQLVPTLLIEDSTLFREGLSQILGSSQFRPVRSIASIDELPDQALAKSKGLLCVCGMTADRQQVLQTIARVKEQGPPGTAIVILSSDCGTEEVRMLLRAGARAVLLKSISSETLIKSLELVMLGETLVPSTYLHMLLCGDSAVPATTGARALATQPFAEADLGETEDGAELTSVSRRLSSRESAILEQLMHGASNKAIARRLAITEATVKVHVKAILRKIRVRNRTQAAMWAVQNLPGPQQHDEPASQPDVPCARSYPVQAPSGDAVALSA